MGGGTQRLDFAEFYRRSRGECLRTVLVGVGDQDTAQDVVAEACARAWGSWRTVSRHPAPAAWVVRTALNANVSRWRRRRREVAVPDPATVADLSTIDDVPGSLIDSQIITAVLRLPARQRQVIALRLGPGPGTRRPPGGAGRAAGPGGAPPAPPTPPLRGHPT